MRTSRQPVRRLVPALALTALLARGLAACSGQDTNASNARDRAEEGASSVAAESSAIAASSRVGAPTPSAGSVARTIMQATIQEPISSYHNSAGQRVRAIVSRNVLDRYGRVVIPGGSTVTLRIAQLRAAADPRAADGVIALDLASVTVGDTTYAARADVGAVPHTLLARAAKSTTRDVIVTAGTPVTITLTQPLRTSAN